MVSARNGTGTGGMRAAARPAALGARGPSARHGLSIVQRFTACSGRAVTIGRRGSPPDPDTVDLSLAGTLGAFDERGLRVPVVALRLTHRDDAGWARAAVHWLGARGRRVLLRTSVVLSHEVVEEALAWGATILLEISSSDPALQRALLGRDADTSAALLLHAQHLRARGLDVAVHLGPVLPSVHDRREVMEPLWRHVAAADIRDAHIAIGHLTATRLAALEAVLTSGRVAAIARAFGLGLPGADGDHELSLSEGWEVPTGGARLEHLTAAHLFHAVRRMAEFAEIRVDRCGCPAQCHLDPERRGDYVDLTTADLFSGVLSGSGSTSSIADHG